MKTSAEWWSETKQDNDKLIAWLKKQFFGELGAVSRIKSVCDLTIDDTRRTTLLKIAAQEGTHAAWVKQLLLTREPDFTPKDESSATNRYWKEVESIAESFELAAAVAALAENMRLERIRVIAADESAPSDIREVFSENSGR